MKRILTYVSDIHLEMMPNINLPIIKQLWNFNRDNNTIYYLALVGDISNYNDHKLEELFTRLSPAYKQIFYVPGNHEYYNLHKETPKPVNYIKNSIQNLCNKFANIKLLDNDICDLDEFIVIGSTLWSHIPESHKILLQNNVNDYNLIWLDENTKLDIETTNKWNKESVEFIESTIKLTKKDIIVLTHHAPLFSDYTTAKYTADPIYINGTNNYAFHNDLKSIINHPIKLWIYGHTHYASKFNYNGVIIATNQLGYASEQEYINFDPTASIDLDLDFL
jgi:predicted phosphohydrolase